MLEKAHAAFANLMHSSFKLLKRNVYMHKPAPISQVVERPLQGAVGQGFESQPRHTKGVKKGTSSSFTDARIKKEGVLGR